MRRSHLLSVPFVPFLTIALFALLSMSACGASTSSPGDDAGPVADRPDDGPPADPDLGSPAIPAGTIRGTVALGAAPLFDGVGNLIIEWGGLCPYTDTEFDIDGLVAVEADYTRAGLNSYEINGVEPGVVQVWGWFDDNGDTIPEVSMAFPFDDLGNVPCATVTLVEEEGATLDLVFDRHINPADG
ncbi:MAG: hypothetical protein ACFCGT_16915 [Sandaracinaceae bacterium]